MKRCVAGIRTCDRWCNGRDGPPIQSGWPCLWPESRFPMTTLQKLAGSLLLASSTLCVTPMLAQYGPSSPVPGSVRTRPGRWLGYPAPGVSRVRATGLSGWHQWGSQGCREPSAAERQEPGRVPSPQRPGPVSPGLPGRLSPRVRYGDAAHGKRPAVKLKLFGNWIEWPAWFRAGHYFCAGEAESLARSGVALTLWCAVTAIRDLATGEQAGSGSGASGRLWSAANRPSTIA